MKKSPLSASRLAAASVPSGLGPIGLFAMGLLGPLYSHAKTTPTDASGLDMLEGLRECLQRAGLTPEQAKQVLTQALQTASPAGKKAALIRLAALAEALGQSQGQAANFERLMDALGAQLRDADSLDLGSAEGLAAVLRRIGELGEQQAAEIGAQALSLSDQWMQAFEGFDTLDNLASYLAQEPLAVLAQAGGAAAGGAAGSGSGAASGGAAAGSAAAASGLSLPAMLALGGLAAAALGGGGGGSSGAQAAAAPGAPAAPLVKLSNDTGFSSSDKISAQGVLSVTDQANQPLAAGLSVEYSRDNGSTWSTSFTPASGVNSIQVRVKSAAGLTSTAVPFQFTLDIDAPDTSATVLTVERSAKTLTLDLGESLSSSDLPDAAQFTVTTQQGLAGPAVNPVANVAVTGGKLVLTLTNAFSAGQVNVVYNRPASGKVLEDLAGNDVVSFFSGVVADGYIRDAEIFVDPGNGAALRNTGVKTNAQGQFFLPASVASEGSLVMLGGVNIDTGLPNTLTLKAPKVENFDQPIVINPLTTLVQTIVESGQSVENAVKAVTSSLGLQEGTQLLGYDPLAKAESLTAALQEQSGDPTALQAKLAEAVSVQKASVQVVATASLASGSDATLSNQMMVEMASQILSNSTSGVSTSFAATLSSAVETAAAKPSFNIDESKLRLVSEATQAIEQASSVQAISQVQAEKLDTIKPLAPTLSVSEFSKTATPTVTLNLNTTDTQGGAVVAGDLLTVLLNGTPVKVLVDNQPVGSVPVTQADLQTGAVQLRLASPLPEGTYALAAHITDLARNQGLPATSVSTTVDLSAPAAALRTSADQLTLGQRATLTFTFSEAVAGFTQDDIAIDGGGSLSNFQRVSATTYSADYVAPSSGTNVAKVSIKAGSYQDLAGNLGAVSNILDLASANPPVVAIKQAGGADGVVSSQAGDNLVSGTAEPNLPVVLKTGGGVVLGEVTPSSATWTYALSSTNLSALRAEANAGLVASQERSGRTGISNGVAVAIDLDPPALTLSTAGVPVVNAKAIAASDAVPVQIAGTTDANTVVQLILEPKVPATSSTPVVVTRSVTANANGAWSYSFSAADVRALGQGAMKATVKAQDAAGNSSTRSLDFGVDTVLPSIWRVGLDAASDTGVVGDGATSKASSTLTLQASGAETVQLLKGTQVLASLSGSNGVFSYSFKAGELTEGGNVLTLLARSSSGNESRASTQVVLDTSAPGVTISSAANAANAQSRDVSYSIVFSEPATGFTAEDLSVTNGSVVAGSFERLGPSSFRVKVAPSANTEGVLRLTVNAGVATDLAGNVNTAGNLGMPLDSRPPAAPTLSLQDDTGRASDDRITRNPVLKLEGLEANALRSEYSTDGGSTWSASFSARQGSNSVQARQVDAAGNAGPASTALSFTFDNVAPAAPSVALSQDTGLADDRVSSNPALALGNQEAGAQVQYSRNDSTWSESFSAVEGANQVYVRQVDAAGNASPSTSLAFTLDTTAPSARVSLAEVWVPGEDGQAARWTNFSQVIGNNTPELRGSVSGVLALGERIEVLNGDTVLSGSGGLASSLNGSAAWSFTPNALANGNYALRVRVVDAAGNISQDASASALTLSINATRPAAQPSITAVIDDVVPVSGNVTTNGFTNDTTPTISGTVGSVPLASGERLRVYDGNTALGFATVSDSGSWTFTPASPLAQGAHNFRVVAQSVAGNQGDRSSVFSLNIDTEAPASPQITGDQSRVLNNVRPQFQLSAEAGLSLKLGARGADGQALLLSENDYRATESGNGQYTLTVLRDLPAGDYGIVAADKSGNTSPQPDSYGTSLNTFRVDLSAPAGLTAYLAPNFDTGVTGDNLTRLSTPQIRGLTEANASIEATVGGKTYTSKADPSGVYSLNITDALGAGAHAVSVTAKDAAGNGRTTTVSFSIDTTPPAFSGQRPVFADLGLDNQLHSQDRITAQFLEPVAVSASGWSLEGPTGQLASFGTGASVLAVNPVRGADGRDYATEFQFVFGAGASLPAGTQLVFGRGSVSDLAGNSQALSARVPSTVQVRVPYQLEDMVGSTTVAVDMSLPSGALFSSDYPADYSRFGTAVYWQYSTAQTGRELVVLDLYGKQLLGKLTLASNEFFLSSGDAASKMFVATQTGAQLNIKSYDIGLQAQSNLQPDASVRTVTLPSGVTANGLNELVFDAQGGLAYILGYKGELPAVWKVAQGTATEVYVGQSGENFWGTHLAGNELRAQLRVGNDSSQRYVSLQNNAWTDLDNQDDFWMSLDRYQGKESVIRAGSGVFDLRSVFSDAAIQSLSIQRSFDLGELGRAYVVETEYGPQTISGHSLVLVRQNNAGTPELLRADLPVGVFALEFANGVQFQKIHVQSSSGALSRTTDVSTITQDSAKAVSVYQPSASQLVAAVLGASQGGGMLDLALLGSPQDFSKAQLANGQPVDGAIYTVRASGSGQLLGLDANVQITIAQRFSLDSPGSSSGEVVFLRTGGGQTLATRLTGDLQEIEIREARDGNQEFFFGIDQANAQGQVSRVYFHLDAVTGALTPVTESLFNTISQSAGLPEAVGSRSNDDSVSGTDSNDVLLGLAGDDMLWGGGGNDELRGGPGRDNVWGGMGNDTLAGGPGADRLWLHEGGMDVVAYGQASDSSGSEIDSIYGFSADDTIGLTLMLRSFTTKLPGSSPAANAVGQLKLFKDTGSLSPVGDNQLRWSQDTTTGMLTVRFDTDPGLGSVALSETMQIKGLSLSLNLDTAALSQGSVWLKPQSGDTVQSTPSMRSVSLAVPYELDYLVGTDSGSVEVDMYLPSGAAASLNYSVYSLYNAPSSTYNPYADFTRFGTALYTFSNGSAVDAYTVDLATQTVLRRTTLASDQSIGWDPGPGAVTFLRSLAPDGRTLTLTPYYIGLGQDPQASRQSMTLSLPFPLQNATFITHVISDGDGMPLYLQGNRFESTDKLKPFLLEVSGTGVSEIALPAAATWLSQVHVWGGKLRGEVGMGESTNGQYPSQFLERREGQWVELEDRGLAYEQWERWRGDNSVLRSGSQVFDLNQAFGSEALMEFEPDRELTWTRTVNGQSTEYSLRTASVFEDEEDLGYTSLLLVSRSNGTAQFSSVKLPVAALDVRFQGEDSILIQQLHVKDGQSTATADSLVPNLVQDKAKALTLYTLSKDQVVSAIQSAASAGGVLSLPGQGQEFSWAALGGNISSNPNTIKFFKGFGPAEMLGLNDGGQLGIVTNFSFDGTGGDQATTQFIRVDAQGSSQVVASFEGDVEDLRLVRPSSSAPAEMFLSAKGPGNNTWMYMYLDPMSGQLISIDANSFSALDQSDVYPQNLGTRGNDFNVRPATNLSAAYGFAGDDRLFGFWGGADTLDGGTGMDTLYGSSGDDLLVGGLGQDRFLYSSQAALQGDRIYGGSSSATRPQIEGYHQDTLILQGLAEGGTNVYDLTQASFVHIDRIDLMSTVTASERIEVKLSQQMAASADANGDGQFGDVRVYAYYFQDAANLKPSTANLLIDASDLGSNSSVDFRGQVGSGIAQAPFGGMSGSDTLVGGAGNDSLGGGLGSDRIDLSQGGSDWVRYSSATESSAASGIDTLVGFASGDKLDLSAVVSAYVSKINGSSSTTPSANQLALYKDSGSLTQLGDNQLRWSHDASTGVFKLQFDTNPVIGNTTASVVMEIRGLGGNLLSVDAEALSTQNLYFVL